MVAGRQAMLSAACLDAVLAVIATDHAERPRAIAERTEFAPATVRDALTKLVRQGRVAHEGAIGYRRYWRVSP